MKIWVPSGLGLLLLDSIDPVFTSVSRATHFQLYLNTSTFVGAEGDMLVEMRRPRSQGHAWPWAYPS